MTMNIDYLIGTGGVALATALVVYALVKGLMATHEKLSEKSDSLLHQILIPLGAVLARRRHQEPELDKTLTRLEKYVRQSAGAFLDGATAEELFAARFVFPAGAAVILTSIGVLLRIPAGWLVIAVLAFGGMLYVWPEQAVADFARKRTGRFTLDLPQVLDVMSLVSESGGDLYSAIRTAVEVSPSGPVRDELMRALGEVAIGTSLSRALNNIAERVGTQDAAAVFSTMAQALEMGTSVGENLTQASAIIRTDARTRAQEKAQKAVVAMTFPLLLLILPGVFIVLFAPMIIQYVSSK